MTTLEALYGHKFTGGANFEGLEKDVHNLIMKTELHDGYGAYKLSYAEGKEGGNSGLSFGGNQMDLGDGKPEIKTTARQTFLDILGNATDSYGNKIISETEYNAIVKKEAYLQKGKRPETVFGSDLPKINSALASVLE